MIPGVADDTADSTAHHPAWRRWLGKLATIGEALSLSMDEIQDRRITRLEAAVAELQKRAREGER